MDFNEFERAVAVRFGLNLSSYKEKQLRRRVDSFLAARNITCYEDYYQLLVSKPGEWKRFLDHLTINVSEFFRNPEAFSFLEKKIIPELLKNSRSLRIWSAGCAHGAEPYSVAIILNELEPRGKHYLEATDIDPQVLAQAKEGKYPSSALKNVSPELLKKYFSFCQGSYQLSASLRARVNFKLHDLLRDPYGKNYDLILCRNVAIYFTRETQAKVYLGFSRALKTKGVLFTGATETIFSYQQLGFTRISPWFYQKISREEGRENGNLAELDKFTT